MDPEAKEQIAQEKFGKSFEELSASEKQVVHSRTFGNAAREGGVGVRMLVPLVDMLNHAGDETSGLLTLPPVPKDNVRWDIVGPERSTTGGWEMVVSAVRPVREGAPLALSYGERSNDDFFTHYGFVPPGNPHDEVQLFEDLEEALEWHHGLYGSQMSQQEAEEVYGRAYQAGLDEQEAELAALKAAVADGKLPKDAKMLKLLTSSRVSGPLVTSFSMVAGGDTRKAEVAIARRGWQLLRGMPTPVTQDLAVLWQDATAGKQADESAQLGRLLQHYHKAITSGGYTPALGEQAVSITGSSAQELAQAYVQGASPAVSPLRTSVQRLYTRYRLYKKMILWDTVLKTGAAMSDME